MYARLKCRCGLALGCVAAAVEYVELACLVFWLSF